MRSHLQPARLTHFSSIALFILAALISCSKKQEPPQPVGQQTPPQTVNPTPAAPSTVGSDTAQMPPLSNSYFVFDQRTNTIFGIDLNTNQIISRLARTEEIVAVQYDPSRNWVYEAVGNPSSGLDIYDANAGKYVERLRYPGAPTAMLYHPLQQKLYIISNDSTNLRVFDPDSVKFVLKIPLTIQDGKPNGPKTLSPGPAGKIMTANSEHPSVTQILTENKFLAQTVIIHDALKITSAVFSYDGVSSFTTDTDQGSIYRVEFGTGRVMAERRDLDKPRMVQIEVTSNTVIVVTGEATLMMLNPDTFRETGKVDLSEHGDQILSFNIPPKANYAELLLDYKGVTRWMRFDLQNWEPTRLVELIQGLE